MAIVYHEKSKEFHLYNEEVSYIIQILRNNELGNLYYGKRIRDRESFGHMFKGEARSLTAYVFEGDHEFSLQYTRQEYPSYGSGDFKYPAFDIRQENGSRISHFEFQSYEISAGKKKLENLPATYVESEEEAETLELTVYDKLTNMEIVLSYTIYKNYPVIARSARFTNKGKEKLVLDRAMSASVDLPDCEYEMIQLDGAWSRERQVHTRGLIQGEQSIFSMRGASSAEHNPFLALKRPDTTEFQGEVYGFSLVYSGSFQGQVVVNNHDMTRVLMGIHPYTFSWPLEAEQSFQTPEVVMVYSHNGLNGMSQAYHKLYRTRLARGYWRDKIRPILMNNWEATFFDFDEEKILNLARDAKDLDVDLFVLDDGWFGKRNDDFAGLGDWVVNTEKLPEGIKGLSEKVDAMGLRFGLWFEPEMVNKDSDLYRAHPDWILQAPGRSNTHSRNQHVLDFSRKEVVDYIFTSMSKVIADSKISYIKWDMNRYITECYSAAESPDNQGKVMHKYILGVYDLYERLTTAFPEVLFESCASGGARFDPGILYYAPQGWASDDTDAIERLKIQYGTSFVYPVSCMGAHVSDVPNMQVGRTTPLETRANIAFFGAFGYELDLNELSVEEKKIIKEQVAYVKQHQELIQKGTFYRLQSPFEGNLGAWMVVSEDRSEALTGVYRILNRANDSFRGLKLEGLDPDKQYVVDKKDGHLYYGDELMYAGISLDKEDFCAEAGDFSSVLYYLKEV